MEGVIKTPAVLRISHAERTENTAMFEEIHESGAFAFRYQWDWAKLPPEIRGHEICGLACDTTGRVYATTRAPG